MPTTEYPRPDTEPAAHRPLFALGRVLATPAALGALALAAADPHTYLARHASGDWGDLGEEDKTANDDAVLSGARILSAYTLPSDERLWIITEADRASTTLLLPLDY